MHTQIEETVSDEIDENLAFPSANAQCGQSLLRYVDWVSITLYYRRSDVSDPEILKWTPVPVKTHESIFRARHTLLLSAQRQPRTFAFAFLKLS